MLMDPFLGSALISAGAGLVSGIGSSLFGAKKSRQAEDRAFERNKELMKMQNDFNVNMWQKQNAYNSPSNQLQLLKQAGVNPAVSDFFGGSGSTAAEVTSASADVPYNSQIGEYYKDMIKDPTQQIIQALTADAQISKLRTEIQYQKLLNRDFTNQLNAREELLPMPGDNGYVTYDKDGNPVVTVSPGYNQYQEQRASGRLDIGTKAIQQQLSADELEVYHDTKDVLKKLTRKQLESLQQDIREKISNNTLLEEDVKLMKKYGISSKDQNEWVTLIRASLRNPDAISHIIDALVGATGKTIQNFISGIKGYGYSHKNVSW